MDVIRGGCLSACVLLLSASSVFAQEAPEDATTPALSGQVLMAGRCPVPVARFERDDSRTCPDHPFPTTLLIRAADTDEPVASLATASDGSFSVALSPGHYLIDPLLADGTPLATSSISVDVPDDGWVTIRVTGGSAARVP
jgi:hypothetical protein